VSNLGVAALKTAARKLSILASIASRISSMGIFNSRFKKEQHKSLLQINGCTFHLKLPILYMPAGIRAVTK